MIARPHWPARRITRTARRELPAFGAFDLFLLKIYRLHAPPHGGRKAAFRDGTYRIIAILSRIYRHSPAIIGCGEATAMSDGCIGRIIGHSVWLTGRSQMRRQRSFRWGF